LRSSESAHVSFWTARLTSPSKHVSSKHDARCVPDKWCEKERKETNQNSEALKNSFDVKMNCANAFGPRSAVRSSMPISLPRWLGKNSRTKVSKCCHSYGFDFPEVMYRDLLFSFRKTESEMYSTWSCLLTSTGAEHVELLPESCG
jgi:hypothetical protein